MQYELYLDVQFLTDFAMNTALLLLTAKILKFPVKGRRIGAAAAVGALANLAVLILQVRIGWKGLAVFPILTAALMQKAAFAVKGWRRLGKAVAVFYGTAFLMAGAVQYINPAARKNLWWFLMSSAGAYAILLLFYRLYLLGRRRHGNIYPVHLYIGEERVSLNGLLDTGNSLRDPWFRKPVTIVEQSALKDVDEACLQQMKLHMIPYSSIGRQNGVLMGIVIPKMVIEAEDGERTVEEPVLAISQAGVSSDKRYQVILHEEYMHN